MRRALTYARDFDALIMHHAADPDLVGSGVMNEGEVATRLGLSGIPKEAEIVIARARHPPRRADPRPLPRRADLLRRVARRRPRAPRPPGLAVTCGVSINHLTLNENDIGPYRTFFKLSPPLRAEDDRRAMVAGLADGTIDVIVSSHDPQDVDTKRHPFAEAADGAVGLETMLAGGAPPGPRRRRRPAHPVPRARHAAGGAPRPRGRAARARRAGRPHRRRSRRALGVSTPRRSARARRTRPSKAPASQGRVLRTLVAGRTVYEYASA